MKDERGSSNNNGSMNNWLGFSLSPHMTNSTQHQTEAPPTSSAVAVPYNYFYLSSSHLTNNAAPIYGVSGNSDQFQSPLSVMPLKSDGSLCIMEALSRSHSQGVVPSSSPKLEDFLGGASMATHQYANAIHSRDAMALSLDSAFYNQQPFRQAQNEYDDEYYYSGLNSNVMYQTTNDHQEQTNKQPIPPPTSISGDEIPCLKTWMDNNYALEQQQVNNNNNSSSSMGDLQCLSLSMSPGSQSSCVTASRQISPTDTTDNCVAMETKKRGSEKLGQNKKTVHRKSIDTFGQRTSQYRGVTRHRWTGRYEAHLWDNSCKKEGQTRKGRQVYLGGYDMEEKAARAYDLAGLKYWGPSTHINFALENYHQELEEMKNMSRQEYVAHLRRKSSGFSRGASIYRGVTRHHQHGRWQARIGRVAGNKDLYLGTFSTQEEAAGAYDIAAIKFRGANAVTNFDISRYDVEKIMTSNTLPTGDVARRCKEEKPCVENVASACGWKTVLNNQSNGQDQENVTTVGNYQNPPFSVALHDLIGNDSSHTTVDESTATMAPHFSNASSLITSLTSSREGTPDKYAAPVFFAKPNDSLISSPSTMIGSWIPTAQMRPVPLTTAHFPVFNAWNDT